jgi:hypothetical protein
MYNELLYTLTKFQGQKCWNVLSCGSAHSLRLSFGKAVEGKVFSLNTNAFNKKYYGQFELFILCTWRLDDEKQRPLISAICDYDYIKKNTHVFLGDTFESFHLTHPSLEMKIIFSSGLKLRVFCDHVRETLDSNNFPNGYCSDEKKTYIVGVGNSISCIERDVLVSETLYEPDKIDFKHVFSDRDYIPKVHLKDNSEISMRKGV